MTVYSSCSWWGHGFLLPFRHCRVVSGDLHVAATPLWRRRLQLLAHRLAPLYMAGTTPCRHQHRSHEPSQQPYWPLYRPTALLGSDLKMFTKILANRLNKYLATIIHPDQVRFIPRRFSFFNVRRLLNIVCSKQNKSKSAVLQLDAHRACDQVDKKYMLLTSENLAWVKALANG